MSLFSNQELNHFRDQMIQSYHDFVEDLREDGPEEETEGLSADFLEHFKFVAESKALNEYSPLNFYWVNLVDNLIYVLQMFQDGDEDGLADFWTESEYAEAYIEASNLGENSIEITSNLMPLLEGQVLGFYHWHISSHHKAKENPTLYQQVSDIGDYDLGIRIGEKHFVAPPEAHNDAPSLPFWTKSFKEESVSLDDDDGELLGGMQKLETIIIDDKEITLKGTNTNIDENILELKLKINNALEIIKKCSPECFEAFKVFTNSLILIDEPGVVSYSLQSLPGYSNINIVERDHIDLIDDLVHENGHHLINAILNDQELLNEDDDKIFWSPWRRALRPVRGMYHGYLTFVWAYILFKDLYLNKTEKFNPSDYEKISQRFVEEYTMLCFCHRQLDYAFKTKKITNDGHSLYIKVKDYLQSEADFVSSVCEELSPLSQKNITELNAHLKDAETEYLNFI